MSKAYPRDIAKLPPPAMQLARLGETPMMTSPTHYLLFSEASRDEQDVAIWRFVLQDVLTNRRFSANGVESTACPERLELLAVVRALESLDGPARVTLVTKSRYVSRGLKRGLPQWRERQWKWERFGKLRPVRDDDLWRRVDGALKFHDMDCRLWQFGTAFDAAGEQAPEQAATTSTETTAKTPQYKIAASVAGEVPVRNRRTRRQRRIDSPHSPGLVVAAKERLRRASESLGSIATSSMAAN
ncbi:Ribonuclease HI [Adhaeretor mobilis]|uniref:Ribonuclease HI n=1 Tax=Adhaeretor mobilis TaxID=1930276 RepID=A0A517MUI1_9BACT|nr:Ribonuclease HI [Adhaeretor mobilis]